MATNPEIHLSDLELEEAARRLYFAARRFYELHQLRYGPAPIVWTENDQGFVLFARQGHADQLKQAARRHNDRTEQLPKF